MVYHPKKQIYSTVQRVLPNIFLSLHAVFVIVFFFLLFLRPYLSIRLFIVSNRIFSSLFTRCLWSCSSPFNRIYLSVSYRVILSIVLSGSFSCLFSCSCSSRFDRIYQSVSLSCRTGSSPLSYVPFRTFSCLCSSQFDGIYWSVSLSYRIFSSLFTCRFEPFLVRVLVLLRPTSSTATPTPLSFVIVESILNLIRTHLSRRVNIVKRLSVTFSSTNPVL